MTGDNNGSQAGSFSWPLDHKVSVQKGSQYDTPATAGHGKVTLQFLLTLRAFRSMYVRMYVCTYVCMYVCKVVRYVSHIHPSRQPASQPSTHPSVHPSIHPSMPACMHVQTYIHVRYVCVMCSICYAYGIYISNMYVTDDFSVSLSIENTTCGYCTYTHMMYDI